ncbi:MAG: adenylate cyclase [Deltaproteobacteria bacterium]|nr:adenylate cyclase [Deltaproteobacteria bacterium]
MGMEIERKFLVLNEDWKEGATGTFLHQGYLNRHPQRSVRVRVKGQQAFMTIKGMVSEISRFEYEYPIPPADAGHMLKELCEPPTLEKTRYLVKYEGMCWEIDEFHGENVGLVVAEIELENEEQPFAKPPWLGEEVSQDSRYLNINLSRHPYCQW